MKEIKKKRIRMKKKMETIRKMMVMIVSFHENKYNKNYANKLKVFKIILYKNTFISIIINLLNINFLVVI